MTPGDLSLVILADSGEYEVNCVLIDGAGRRAAARATLSVISSTL